MRLKKLLLDTPQKYWLVIGKYHVHKAFWGIVFIFAGLVSNSCILLAIGIILIALSIAGRIYTHHKPYYYPKPLDKLK